jgi:peroxiredoxin Q/BCP
MTIVESGWCFIFIPRILRAAAPPKRIISSATLAQYQAKGVTILGVSVDTADSHKKFCTQEGLNFKLLSDADHRVSEEYGSIMNLGVKKLSARHTFIINPDGVIVKEFLDVNPGKHSEEVLAALTELQKT